MALSKEDKEALNDYYHNKDLYDPSKAPEQEVASFKPQELSEGGYADGGYCGMCGGGCVGDHEKGYAQGGDVEDMFSVANSSAPVSGMAGSDPNDWEGSAGYAMPAPKPMPKPDSLPEGAFSGLGAPDPDYIEGLGNVPQDSRVQAVRPGLPGKSAVATGNSDKLSPDQFNQLIQGLKPGLGARLAQGATSGIAGFADAIMQGVAQQGPGQFQKNIEEERQNQKQNLINALKAKYETQFRGQELGLKGQEVGQAGQRLSEEMRHNLATEKEATKGRETQAGQLAQQMKYQTGQQAFEQSKETRQAAQDEAKQRMDAAQKIVEAYEKGAGRFFGTKFGQERPSDEAYLQAQKVLQNAGRSNTPKIGGIVPHKNGNFKFIGGNPADPKSWQKI